MRHFLLRQRKLILAVGIFLCLVLPAWASTCQIKNIRMSQDERAPRIVLDVNQKSRYTISRLPAPNSPFKKIIIRVETDAPIRAPNANISVSLAIGKIAGNIVRSL